MSIQLSRWLADTKFGNYKVFRVGAVLLFISIVMKLVLVHDLKELVWESNNVLKWVHLYFCEMLWALSLVKVSELQYA